MAAVYLIESKRFSAFHSKTIKTIPKITTGCFYYVDELFRRVAMCISEPGYVVRYLFYFTRFAYAESIARDRASVHGLQDLGQ
jgi:hypothetical protein